MRRCCAALETALQSRQESHIAAVVHGGTIMAVLSALEQQQKAYFSWQVKPCTPVFCRVVTLSPLRLAASGS
ncbi:MAG: histidine phosphatase family protein [Ruminococcus callidus]